MPIPPTNFDVLQSDAERRIVERLGLDGQKFANVRLRRVRTLKRPLLNGMIWSFRTIKRILTGPHNGNAKFVIMHSFAQTGLVGIPSACEKRC